MQFVPTSYFSGYANASQQQALQQQQQQQQQQPQQQQQQQQQQNSPHASQSPAPSTTQVEQHQQPPQPQPMGLPTALPGFAQAGMPVATATTELNAQGKPKRKQVKNACVNCQKACKKCDDGRPCQRCVKYGLQETCVNSVRKERKKGIKRGPYKKRKQADGSSSTDGSTTSAQNVSGTTSLPGALYAQTSQASSAVRTNGVLAYQPFQSGTYDAFHAAAVSYQNSASMIPHAYMVPAMQQMYPTNPILSYQAAMNMLSPQHGQSSPNIYAGFRQDNQQQPPSQDQTTEGQQQHRSHEGSPATPTGGVSTPNIKNENATATATTTTESDDEGSKLNILSQLCSAVLDRAPAESVKQEDQQQTSHTSDQTQQQDTTQQQQASPAVGGEATSSLHQSTPPPSRDHSREVSNEADVKTESTSNQ
ncbi:hypothetical protein BDA99DRAFT_558702 [Phascolomyces articulosus]|uniref:Zn(2)-C6 fungal-type domain-containing protein n=1 Tax=Phascolomyces articulosus TaxID=60185 RepID=A0AAD5PEY4_9FUNG|nr:hypothetical protein BDA99DRAFT_558702 [Phascolomyces articulosus]